MPKFDFNCSIVVPVYRGEGTLTELTERLVTVMEELCPEFEILYVNDGSPDHSREVIEQLEQRFPSVRGIQLMRNYGQHNATLCGVRQAKYEVTITMDDDLQHPPEEIVKLLDTLQQGFDVVYGIPARLPHSWWRNMFSRLTKKFLAAAMGIPTIRDIGAFRAFRTGLRKAFATYSSPNVILDVLLSWGTTKFGTTVVNEKEREVGRSNYNFWKLFSTAMTVLTGFSTIPLRMASILGFVFTLFGLGILIYAIVVSMIDGSIPGFPFLASIIAIFSGAQLVTLGIFGEYLARIFDRSMDRPTYVIEEPPSAKEVESL